MSSAPALAVEGACVALGGRSVLREVTFRLAPGEFCALIGSNGSGKTTLLRAILGFVPLEGGAVRLDGNAGRAGPIGYVPQKIALDPALPLRARDVVALGLDGARLGLSWPSKARSGEVDRMLQAVGADGFAEQRIGLLSGGQQQRVLVAHALVRRPRLLLLDEPLANLDVRSAAAAGPINSAVARMAPTVIAASDTARASASAWVSVTARTRIPCARARSPESALTSSGR